MLSKNVLIAFFLAVCFRNSSVDGFTTHNCENDQQVVDVLRNLPHKSVPILIFKDKNPMKPTSIIDDFIKGNYDVVIFVNNTNNQCRITDDILNRNSNIMAREYPSLFMTNEGKLLLENKVTEFLNINLQKIKNAALNSNTPTTSSTLLEEIINQWTSEAKNVPFYRGPYPPERHPGIVFDNTVPGPVNSMTRSRSLVERMRSGEPRPVASLRPRRPIKPQPAYPPRRTRLGELDLLAAMENQSGGSSATPSQTQGLEHNRRLDPSKRPKLEEGTPRPRQ